MTEGIEEDTSTEEKLILLEMEIRRLEVEMVTQKNKSWKRADFQKCIYRLHQLKVSPEEVIQGLKAADLVGRGKIPDWKLALDYVKFVDKNGSPEKHQLKRWGLQ